MDTKIRVILDTKQAKGELRELSKEGERTAGRVGERVRRSVAGGIGAGVGFAVGTAGIGAVAQSSAGDILSETFGAFSGELEQLVFGNKGEEARAQKAARDQIVEGYAFRAGLDGKIPPEAIAEFQQLKALRSVEEKGRGIIERADAFRSVGFEDVVKGIGDRFAETVKEAMSDLKTFLTGGLL